MFNYYSFDKKKIVNDKLERMKDDYVKNESHRKKKQEQLVLSYKKRVDNFVMQMVEHPIIQKDRAPTMFKYRDEDTQKFLGPPSFSFKSFKHEKDRIAEAMLRNSEKTMMTQGPPVKIEYRTREPAKEIQPEMHFTSTGVERIASTLERMINNSVELTGEVPQRLSDSFLLEISESPVATKRFIAKNLLPELHYKTHFKAATSLFLSLQDSLQDQYERDLQNRMKAMEKEKEKDKKEASFMADGSPAHAGSIKITSDMGELPRSPTISLPNIKGKMVNDAESDKKGENSNKKHQLEGLDPREVSKNILTKCNIIQPRKPTVNILRKGDGHLMSMSDKSMRDIYDEIYNKTIDTTME
jgi:hypothetical protein